MSDAILPLVRVLVQGEIDARREAQDGCGDTLVGLCFLLYLIGEASDVALIHAAKRSSMDAGAMLDCDLYQMRRTRDEVIAAVSDPQLIEAIGAAFDHPNYDSVADFERSVRAYLCV